MLERLRLLLSEEGTYRRCVLQLFGFSLSGLYSSLTSRCSCDEENHPAEINSCVRKNSGEDRVCLIVKI